MSTLDPQSVPSGGAQIVGGRIGDGPGPDVMAASTLEDTKVVSSDNEHVGKISHIMLDVRSGTHCLRCTVGRRLPRNGHQSACHSMDRVDT